MSECLLTFTYFYSSLLQVARLKSWVRTPTKTHIQKKNTHTHSVAELARSYNRIGRFKYSGLSNPLMAFVDIFQTLLAAFTSLLHNLEQASHLTRPCLFIILKSTPLRRSADLFTINNALQQPCFRFTLLAEDLKWRVAFFKSSRKGAR